MKAFLKQKNYFLLQKRLNSRSIIADSANISSTPKPLHDHNFPVCPLTEENLALHAINFPPCKDARRQNALLFVQNQHSIIKLELELNQKREQEFSSLVPLDSVVQFSQPFTHLELEKKKRKQPNWLKQLKKWLVKSGNSSSVNNQNTRHVSCSPGIAESENENENKKLALYHFQNRDSGISFGKRRVSSIKKSMAAVSDRMIESVPIVRQPKFGPPQDRVAQLKSDFIAFKYPKMMKRPTATTTKVVGVYTEARPCGGGITA